MARCSGRYARIVPRDHRRNAVFRQKILNRAKRDKMFQACLLKMCRDDVVFFVNVFLWTYDPRAQSEGRTPVNPFATWEIQDDFLTRGRAALGKKDIAVEKSRDQGLTWLTLALIVHDYVFGSNVNAMVCSWKEEYVFGLDDPKTLFWKIDFMLQKLPSWMRPESKQLVKSFHNKDRNNYINGEATTTDIGRAGRCTYVFLDEFAKMDGGYAVEDATRAVTDCRIGVSTPRGHNHFKDFIDRSSKVVEKFTIHWTSHPLHSKGKYQRSDGKWRSKWYDEQCARALSLKSIARELDISYDESTDRQFSEGLVTTLINGVCKTPTATGRLALDKTIKRLVFLPGLSGNLKIWFPQSDYGGPPSGYSYTCGCDISMGNGSKRSSNSVMSFWCDETGEKVAEYATNDMEPSVFAHEVLPHLHWFSPSRPCHLIWESNGPGQNFSRVILEAGWPNMHFQKHHDRLRAKTTDVPGFRSDANKKRDILDTYARMMLEQRAFNRSQEAVLEMRQFVILMDGKVEHQKAVHSEDTADSGANHGDRVIADALAIWSMWKRGLLRDTTQFEWKKARDPLEDVRDYIAHVAALQKTRREEQW